MVLGCSSWMFLLNVPLVSSCSSWTFSKKNGSGILVCLQFFPTFAIGKKCARALSAGFRGRTRIHSFTSEKDRMLCLMHEMYLAYAADNGIDPGSPYETDTTQRTPRLCSVCPVRSGKATVICHTRPLWLPFIYSARVRFHWLEIEHTYYRAFALVLFSRIPPIIQRLRTSSKKVHSLRREPFCVC